MTPQRIVFLDRASIRAQIRRPEFPHCWEEYPSSTAQEVRARLTAASIAISNKVELRGDLLAQLPQLQMIAVAATGTDHIDLDWCQRHGIVVSNIRAYARHSVPEHVLMLMLALRRQLLAYRADIATGKWSQAPAFCFFDHPIRDLQGSTLGLLGRGCIGQEVARCASAFGMRILWGERKGAASVRPGYVSFARLLAEADVISLHCPLTAGTRHLIGASELQAMRPGALLINTARGGLVDATALAAALRQGRIGGAGIDVLDQEPPPADHPLLATDLLAQPRLILTPHIGWASETAMQTLADQLIDNIEAFVAGQPQNCCP